MDWTLAIARNRDALRVIVGAVAVLLDGMADRVPRALHRSVAAILGPAESALRRLIVIAARGVVAKPLPARPGPMPALPRTHRTRLAFRLFDRRKYFPVDPPTPRPGPEPRLHVIGGDPRIALFRPLPPLSETHPATPSDDGMVDLHRLRLRLEAARRALDTLPRHAQRLARWRARRDRIDHLKRRSPLRPGPPPGHRKRPQRDIDFVLAECHGLAHDALAADTS